MRLLLVLSGCLVLATGGVFSQNLDYTINIQDSVGYDYYEKTEELLENLDVSEVTSGILYERGFPFVNFEPFKGGALDTVTANRLTFSLAYASLFSMAMDTVKRLPLPQRYMQKVDALAERELVDTIPFLILHQNYHRLKAHAQDSNLVTLSNDQFYDVPGRSESPFQEDSVCMVAAAREKLTTTGALTFTLDTTLWFSNTGKVIDQLRLNFGNGWQDLKPGMLYTHTFDSTGVYPFSAQVVYLDGTVSHSKSYVEVELKSGPNFVPSYSQRITSPIAYWGESGYPPGMYPTSPYGAGMAHVYLACGHEDIVKPFIWVEGYNPRMSEAIDLGLSFDDALIRLNYQELFVTGPLSILEHLQNEGYDIIVLDYDDGGTYIQRNAYFFVEAMQWINQVKRDQGSIEKNVVMGQSMGGMVARYGLRWMEMNAIDHETATYISFDTGHQGTNVPLGAQMAVRHVAGLHIGFSALTNQTLEDFVAPLRDARRLLDIPASRQMLAFQTYGPLHPFNLHNQYYSEQNVVLGMPQNCEILAIANGSQLAVGGAQNFLPGTSLLSAVSGNIVLMNGLVNSEAFQDDYGDSEVVGGIVASAFGPFITFGLGTSALAVADIRAAPDGNGVVYTGIFHVSVLNYPIILSNKTGSVEGMKPVDSSPGGAMNPILFPQMIPPYAELINFNIHAWSFTPVVSTLNFAGGVHSGYSNVYTNAFTNPVQALQQNQAVGIDHYIATASQTVYNRTDKDGVVYPENVTLNNTLHTFFNPRIAPWFLYHLVGEEVPAGMTSLTASAFNFGKTNVLPQSYYQAGAGPVRTRSVLDHDLTLNSQGILRVNGSAPIGFSNSGDGVAADNSVFSVKVRGGECGTEEVIVTVNSGGQLILGDGADRRGEMVFYPNTKLVINSGGEVIVRPGSNMVFEEGSELILNGGRLHIEDNARVMQKSQSPMTVNENSEFMLTGHGSLYYTHGQINLGDNTTFEIGTATNAKGRIVIRGTEMDYANWGQNTALYLIGDDKDDELIRFEQKGMLLVTPDAEGDVPDELRIMHCLVRFTEDTEHEDAIISSTRIRSTRARFVNENDLVAQHIRVAAPSTFRQCEFDNAGIWSYLFEPSNRLTVFMSDFNNHRYISGTNNLFHAIQNERGNVHISYSTFDNCNAAIRTEDLSLASVIDNNTFVNPPGNARAYADDSQVEITFKKNTIDQYAYGVSDSYGKMNVLCNEFLGTSVSTLEAHYSSMDLSRYFRLGGYNRIESNHTGPVILANTAALKLIKGYNKITNPGLFVEGTTSWACMAGYPCEVSGIANQWANDLTPPSSAKFNLTSYIGQTVSVPTDPVLALKPCKVFDAGGVIGNPVYSFSNADLVSLFDTDETEYPSLPLVNTASYNNVRLDVAILTALYKMDRRDSTQGDNAKAMTLLDELISDQITRRDIMKSPELFSLVLSEMKYIVEEEIMNDTLSAWPATTFTFLQGQYARLLNEFTNEFAGVPMNNQIFALELDKAHFMRQVGSETIALEILESMEQCGVDSIQQIQVNHRKKAIIKSIQIASQPDKVKAFEPEPRTVDTSTFILPSAAIPLDQYSGTILQNPTKADYITCGGKKSSQMITEEPGFEVRLFPNPNTGEFILTHNHTDEEELALEVYSISGAIVYSEKITSDRMKVNMGEISPGVYYYRVRVTEHYTYSGKLIVH